MSDHLTGPSMSQKIFAMNLGVEAISLYLLCCAIADASAAITRQALQDKWNGDEATLLRELQRLEERNVIQRTYPQAPQNPVYEVVDEKDWH